MNFGCLACISTLWVGVPTEALPPFTLTVRDEVGMGFAGWVTGGWPFAAGVLTDFASLRLFAEGGTPVPVQLRPLARWRDGSWRWVAATFPVRLPPGGKRTFTVRIDPTAPVPDFPGPLTVREEAGAVLVDTGPLQLRLDRQNPSGSRLTVQGVTFPWPVTIIRADTGEYRSDRAAPDEVAVEAKGPLMAEVRWGTWLLGPAGERHWRVIMRVQAFAGAAELHLLHTVQLLAGPDLLRLSEIALEFPGPEGLTAAQVEGGPGVPPPLRLFPGPEGYTLTGEGWSRNLGPRPRGALAWTSGEVWALLCTRHFWPQGPKGAVFSPQAARLQLLSAETEPFPFGRTRAKSHELRLTFHPVAAAPPLTEEASQWETPPLPLVAPAYLCATEALGVLSPVDPTFWPEFEEAVAGAFDRWRREAETDAAYYGLMNYGDAPLAPGAYGHTGVAYVDQEYDLTHALLQLYARSGDRRAFDWGAAAARHFMDVDVNQVTGEPRYHGYRAGCETHQAVTTGLEWGHVFLDGLVDFYYLTGDRRALEIARRIGEVCCRLGEGEGYGPRRAVFRYAERNLGWPLLSLMRIYEATLDEKYRRAAAVIVAYLNHYAEDPREELRHGTWWRSWMIDGCKPFMTGLLHEGLDKYHELTDDEATKRSILTSLDWLIAHMWSSERETFLYEFNAYNPGHRDVYPTHLNLLVAHAFGYGYRISGEEKYLEVGLRALRRAVGEMVEPSRYGKEFAQALRSTPQFVGHLYRARETFRWPPPPKPLPPKEVTPPQPAPPVRPPAEPFLRLTFDDASLYGVEGRAYRDPEAGPPPTAQPTFVAGHEGRALRLSANFYGAVTVPADFLSRPGGVSLWLRPEWKLTSAAPAQRAIFHLQGGEPFRSALTLGTIYHEIRVRLYDERGHLCGTLEANASGWQPGQWHHLALTWAEGAMRLDFDGQQVAFTEKVTLPPGPVDTLYLGWRPGNWFLNAAVDEVTLWRGWLSLP